MSGSQLCLGGNQCGGDFGDAVGSSGRFLAKGLELRTTNQLHFQDVPTYQHQILWVVGGDILRPDVTIVAGTAE